MTKSDRKPDPDFEPDYDAPDGEYDEVAQAEYAPGPDVEYDELTDPDYDDSVQADYELAADPDYSELAVAATLPEPVAPTADSPFAFALGGVVLPLTQQQRQLVVWRGHLRERHPATGFVQRVPVYRLADGHWDCYREEELRAA